MPDPDTDQVKILNQTMGVFLDMMVQVVALQFALVEAGTLTADQIKRHADRLNLLPSIVSARTTYGRSEVLDGLLRAYEGPKQ
jgi:hypothetical protein